MRDKFLFTVVTCFTLFCVGCASHATHQDRMASRRLNGIQIGAHQDEIKKKLGSPSQVTENYGPLKLRLFEYFDQNSNPDLQVAINSQSGKLVEKAMWIDPTDSLYSRSEFNSHFNSTARTTYFPCHTRSDKDTIEANEGLGFYSAIENDHPVYVSWSTPEIVKLRIDQLYEKCPARQPTRK